MEESKREFLRRCIALNLSIGSIQQYEKVLKRYFKYCKDNSLSDPGEVKAAEIRDYLNSLSVTCKPVTQKLHYMTLSVYYNFLSREGLIKENPMKRIERPKVPLREIQAFSRKEIDIILNGFDKNTFLGYRNYTIMIILFGTGLRLSELSHLSIRDISFEMNFIKVIGKGNKQRAVPMSETVKKVILHYLRMRKEYIDNHQLLKNHYLLIGRTGQRLESSGIWDVFSKIAKDEKTLQGVRVSPHTFRHTFAKYFILNGGDVFALQRILGHSDITVTKKYVNLNTFEVSMQNDRYNPLQNKTWRYI